MITFKLTFIVSIYSFRHFFINIWCNFVLLDLDFKIYTLQKDHVSFGTNIPCIVGQAVCTYAIHYEVVSRLILTEYIERTRVLDQSVPRQYRLRPRILHRLYLDWYQPSILRERIVLEQSVPRQYGLGCYCRPRSSKEVVSGLPDMELVSRLILT